MPASLLAPDPASALASSVTLRRPMWILRAAALTLATLGVTAQEPLVPRPDLKPLEQAALEVARTGRADEWRELAAVLVALGLPQKDAEVHRNAAERELAKARKTAPGARAGKSVATAANTLAARLPTVPEERRERFAELLLQLDSDLATAHEVLRHEKTAKGWMPTGEGRREAGRAALTAAYERARKLDFPIVESASDDTRLTAALGAAGTRASFGKFDLHSHFPAHKTVRILRQTLRAFAFANFLDTGKLELPDYRPQKSVLFRTREQYLTAVRELAAAKVVSAANATAATAEGCYSWRFTDLDPALQLCSFQTEADATAMWLATLEYWRGKYPCLNGGRIDFVCRTMIGRPMPNMSELVLGRRPAGTSAAGDAAERDYWLGLAQAGMRGGRLWMRWLASRGEAPKWTATMHERLATLRGDELLKATLMVEFLAEEGSSAGLAERAVASGRANQQEALEAGLGESAVELERRWQAWLLGTGRGLAQRLQETTTARPPSPMLAALRQLRERAGRTEPLEIDDELGAGCSEHARYLHLHRAQTERWPDCHEQYPDQEGWSAAGSMAGLASVIAPGVKSDQQALDAWMATFFHRLPLLQPGLRRIGWARERDIAVLDCTSMVDPGVEVRDELVLWPHDGMTGTPIAFAPELPDPVPGEDQAKFGYPITVQYTRRSSGLPVELRMVLREQNERGPEVPCWFTSPQAPRNPDLVPADAACLIPKAALRRGTTYHVELELVGENVKQSWTFKT
jgi:hypothetical protein